jgi:hypothetical protein
MCEKPQPHKKNQISLLLNGFAAKKITRNGSQKNLIS